VRDPEEEISVQLSTTTVGSGSRSAALVHGASASSAIWRDLAAILAESYDYTVTLVDLRGHGASPHADSYRVSDFVSDLVETLPTGLDVLMGQSLGGRAGILASPQLRPKRFIGLDPALYVSKLAGFGLRYLSGPARHLPDRVLKVLGVPPKGSTPDAIECRRSAWRTWDPSMMGDLAGSVRTEPFVIGPPAVPSTLLLADKSFVVSSAVADQLRAVGWDVRVKPGSTHDLHLQDPAGCVRLLDDVLR
jgi:pimeloyl-ACP methyl ester carboxylesterase